MTAKMFLLAGACLLLAASSISGLRPLVLDAQELHESLVMQDIDEVPLHVPRAVLQGNPQISTDPEFVRVIARAGSQGRLTSEGIRTALYALYRCEAEVGFYGLEATTTAEADRRERLLREIWVKNVSLDRARIHRRGEILLVIWNDGVPPSCWEAVNAVVAERLAAP